MDGRLPDGPDAGRPDESRAPGRRVLVVDDNEVSSESLALILQLEGYEVRAAADGESAMAIARAFGPGVILSDLGLPGIDGHELARRLLRDPEVAAGLRLLVAVTGRSDAEALRCSREAGYARHLVKPIDPEVILALLASIEWHEAPAAAEVP